MLKLIRNPIYRHSNNKRLSLYNTNITSFSHKLLLWRSGIGSLSIAEKKYKYLFKNVLSVFPLILGKHLAYHYFQ